MTPDDRVAACVVLVCMVLFTVMLTIAAHQVIGVVRERPATTKDPYTGKVQIVRSPNPTGRRRKHGR